MNLLEPSLTSDIVWTIIAVFAITIGCIISSKESKRD
nr:MAG TPA: hypothetical protein [Crassvirales sp.]